MTEPIETEHDMSLKAVVTTRPHMVYPDSQVFTDKLKEVLS